MNEYHIPGLADYMRRTIAPYRDYARGGRVSQAEPNDVSELGMQYAPDVAPAFAPYVPDVAPTYMSPYGAAPAAPAQLSHDELLFAAKQYQDQVAAQNAQSATSGAALSNYIRQQAALGNEVASTDTSVGGGGSIGGALNFGSQFAPTFNPANPAASTGNVYRFNTGSQVGSPDASGNMTYQNAAPVVFQNGQNYVLTDPSGQKVLGNANTPEQMKALVEQAGGLNKQGFNLYQGNADGSYTPGTQLFGRRAEDNTLKYALAAAAIAAGGAYALPYLTGAAPAAGAAGGITVSGMAPLTAGLTDSALAGLTGLSSAGLATGAGGLSAALPAGLLSGAASAVPAAAEVISPAFTVTAGGGGLSTIPAALAATTPAAAGALSSAAAQPPPMEMAEQTVTAPRPVPSVFNLPPLPYPIVPPLTPINIPPITPPAAQPPPMEEPEQISTAPRPVPSVSNLPPLPYPIVPPLTPINIPPITSPNSTTPPKSNIRANIRDALTLAGLLSGGVGAATQGGGQIISGNIGGLPSVFHSSLPTANLPGLSVGQATAPRTAGALSAQGLNTPKDYYRYGYGPAQSFFNYVPQGAPNTSNEYTGYAGGGDVAGPGDGRSDSIPARLSDGEYVMDAETVSLLGNGSNKAGAQALNSLRVNLRKDKGRGLAKGNFSVKAKAPSKYMTGGRS